MLTSEQIKAARALLRWGQKDLSKESGVSIAVIKRIEKKKGEVEARKKTQEKLTKCLTKAGIEFCSGEGRIGVSLLIGSDKKESKK